MSQVVALFQQATLLLLQVAVLSLPWVIVSCQRDNAVVTAGGSIIVVMDSGIVTNWWYRF